MTLTDDSRTAHRLESSLTAVNDVDSHEMTPLHMWVDVFGDGAAHFLELAQKMELLANSGLNSLAREDVAGDTMEVTFKTAWEVRGSAAPSAIDLKRRPELLDVMGVRRQLVFPTFATTGLFCVYHPLAHEYFGYDPKGVDKDVLGREVVEAHNQWAARTGKEFGTDRVRPVAVLLTDSLSEMMTSAEAVLADGVRAVTIPVGVPPAGLSPADRALDPFWRLFTDANVPVTIHIGTEFPLLRSLEWDANIPEFASSSNSSVEFPVQPFWGSTLNLASETFLTAMVLGGVFERNPTLRFGMIEVGAQWIGPLSERLDMWATEFSQRLSKSLSMKPSEYLNRNVRVAPFNFEDIGYYFNRYPNVADCYCYSSDFPHVEGGKHSKEKLLAKLESCDDSTVRKFFVENGELLLPE